MPDFLASMVRSAALKVVGVVAVWLVAHGVPLPAGVRSALESWLVLGTAAFGLWLWNALVRWCETAKGTSMVAVYRRALGRVLMLGLAHKPTYPDPVGPAIPATPPAAPSQPSAPAA